MPKPATQRLFAWPDPENLRGMAILAIVFAVVWGVVFGGANYLTTLHSVRFPLHMDWELQLPFVPEMAFLYLSMTIIMQLPLLVYRTWQELVPLFVVLVAQTLIAGAFFLLLPAETAFPDQVAVGFIGDVFQMADAFNLEHNYFPSLHVSYAFTIAMAIGKRCGRTGKFLFVMWAVGIAISAVLIRQHYLADIIAGVTLALAVTRLCDRAHSPMVLRVTRIIEGTIRTARSGNNSRP